MFTTILLVAWIWAEIKAASARRIHKIYLNALETKEEFERREEGTR
jgi:hypothetical protein